jgi:hypothetical protein
MLLCLQRDVAVGSTHHPIGVISQKAMSGSVETGSKADPEARSRVGAHRCRRDADAGRAWPVHRR